MNGFLRALTAGLAALCVVILTAGITALMSLRGNGTLTAQHLRPLILTEEEKVWLEGMHHRAPEPVDIPKAPAANESEMLGHIAEMAGAAQANQLMTRLRRQQEALDERQTFLDQQWADLQLAKAGLERLQRQVQEQERNSLAANKDQAEEQSRWAAAQVAEAKRMQVVAEVEKTRYLEQTKLFEQMKDNAWQSLRRFPPREIARYLALMEGKKAARMMVLAQQDAEYPNIAVDINQEMLRIDLNAATGDQLQRMATLYSFMSATEVLPYLQQSSLEDIANLLVVMGKNAPAKKVADLLEALRAQDSKREIEIRKLMEKRQATAQGGAQ
jgi:hypothetical protein